MPLYEWRNNQWHIDDAPPDVRKWIILETISNRYEIKPASRVKWPNAKYKRWRFIPGAQQVPRSLANGSRR